MTPQTRFRHRAYTARSASHTQIELRPNTRIQPTASRARSWRFHQSCAALAAADAPLVRRLSASNPAENNSHSRYLFEIQTVTIWQGTAVINSSHDPTLPYAMLQEDLENVADFFLHQYRSPELVADLVLFFTARILDFEEHHYSDFEKTAVFDVLRQALDYRQTFDMWPDTRPEAANIAAAYTVKPEHP